MRGRRRSSSTRSSSASRRARSSSPRSRSRASRSARSSWPRPPVRPGRRPALEQFRADLGLAVNNALAHDRLERLAAVDPLTDAYNRRFGMARLARGVLPRGPRRGPARRPDARPRPLQGRQRHLRPPGRRPRPARRRAGLPARHPRGRRPRPLRRRGVPRPAAGRRRGRREPDRRADPARGRRDLRRSKATSGSRSPSASAARPTATAIDAPEVLIARRTRPSTTPKVRGVTGSSSPDRSARRRRPGSALILSWVSQSTGTTTRRSSPWPRSTRMFLAGTHSGYLSTADPEFVQIPSVSRLGHAGISEKCAW